MSTLIQRTHGCKCVPAARWARANASRQSEDRPHHLRVESLQVEVVVDLILGHEPVLAAHAAALECEPPHVRARREPLARPALINTVAGERKPLARTHHGTEALEGRLLDERLLE